MYQLYVFQASGFSDSFFSEVEAHYV
jgi:hypothetical protein